jgi:transcriptional regulator with PAS, ATPase and Fis domain
MKQAFVEKSSVANAIHAPQTVDPNLFVQYALDRKQQQLAQEEMEAEDVFITVDDKMLQLRDVIQQIAHANVPVLITGESGTGKEVVARAIHQASQRAAKSMVAVNCAALPSTLLESELFGFEKGSFTDAHARHLGKFERANGGTLLLDEVTEIDARLQAKLLRVLQEKEVERLGGNGPLPVDVRIIATTNRDIVSQVAQGLFRQDLYYRLYVIHLEIPPLRERVKDIPVLAEHFLRKFGQKFGKPDVALSPEGVRKLMTHRWSGNVRELQNVLQRALLTATGNVIAPAHIALNDDRAAGELEWVRHLPIGRQLMDVETHFILETLKSHQGNRTHAAKTLGISLRTLRNKINEFTARGIEVMQPQTGKAL